MSYQKDESVFLDKINFGNSIVDFALQGVQLQKSVTTFVRQRGGDVSLEELYSWEPYSSCWEKFSSLWEILKNDYSIKLDEEERKLLYDIFDRWECGEMVTLKELNMVKDLLVKLLSVSGFLDLMRRGETIKGLDKIGARYKIKIGEPSAQD